MGRIVATGLLENSKGQDSSTAEAHTIYEGMKRQSEDIVGTWKLPMVLISLPAKPIINPIFKKLRTARIQMLLSKKISKERFITEGFVIDYTANLINSLSLGFVVCVILRLLITRRNT